MERKKNFTGHAGVQVSFTITKAKIYNHIASNIVVSVIFITKEKQIPRKASVDRLGCQEGTQPLQTLQV